MPERLDRIVEECLEEAAADLAARALAVTRQFSAAIPEAPIDRALVKEAVTALLSEAIRTVGEGGRLRVTVKSSRNALMFSVKAPGRGLTQVQRELLFAGEARPGSLARVRAIVAACGGMAWANAMPGKGVTYYMTFPAPAGGARPPA